MQAQSLASTTQPPYFCMVRHIPMLRAHLLQNQLELALIQATRPNEVYCFHDRGHYIIQFQNLSTQFLGG